ncbi:MAG: response regulator [Lacrimispora sp.]|uniref:response regulator transcription factor n=1 Tax=Lacrimispora sp. TaxID=2719234 RepID=UPI0039E388AC
MEHKVIVCDDEKIIRQGIRKIIETAYDDVEVVSECKNGEEGYKEAVIHTPELIITDVRMPVVNGLDLARLCSGMERRPKIILISAYSEFEYARTAMRYGVSEYIIKPVNRFELVESINRILGISETSKAGAEPADSVRDNSVIGRAKEYIDRNFYKNISLEDVSQKVGVNPNYLSSLFKKQLEMKYIEYLTELRMEKARNLLLNTDLKVNEISEMVGYLSTKHFTRIYKEKFGVTPSEGREK